MKQTIKSILAFAALLLCGGAWAATYEIWNGDFASDVADLTTVTQITKSDRGAVYTLKLNGNKIKRGEDGRTYLEITNSDALSLGVTIARTPNSNGGTMVVKYSDLAYTGSDAYAVIGALSSTLSGGYNNINGLQIADASRTIKGFWADGYWDTHANGLSDVDDTIPAEGCFALSYKDIANTATSAFKSTGDGSWTKFYQNGGKGSNTYSIKGFSVGGLYEAFGRTDRDTSHSTAGFHSGARPATGMKIHAIAFAAEGISDASGLSSFKFGDTESREGDVAVSYVTAKAPTTAPAVEVGTDGTAFGNNTLYQRTINSAVAHSVKVTGATGTTYSIYGGRGENDCGTLTSDIWLNVAGGTFRSIYGGSNGNKWSGGSSQHINGNIVVEVGGDAVTDYVFGGSFKDGYTQTYNGNIDVVVKDSAVVKGTIAGAGFSTHNKTTTYNGDVNVLVKNVQNDNTATKINKTNTQGFIIGGGIFDTNANGQQNIVGNATVTIDIENGSGTFGKTIVGGGLINSATDGYGQAKVSGNTAVNINAPGVRFTAPIYAGALKNGNNGTVSVGGTATITVNGGVFTDKAGNNANFYGGTATGAKKLVLNCDEELYFSQINGFDELENNANFSFYVTAADPREFSAPITGNGALKKMGAGTLILSGNNTYAGDTTVSYGTIKATTKHALGSGTVTVANGASLTVPASDETSYTLGGGAVKILISPEQQAGQMPFVTGIKVREGADLTLSVVDTAGAALDTLEATVQDGVVVISAVVEFKDVTWDSENSQWIDGNGNVVEMGNSCNVTLKDNDSVSFTATPNTITLPDSGTVTINNHQNLGAILITVPARTTLILPTSGYNANLRYGGAGTIRIGGTNTATKHNLYDGWLRNSNLESFTGTIHMFAGRFETNTEAIRSEITLKVTNGSQLSTGATGTWNNHFILSGNGWTGESGEFNTVPLRLAATIGESAIIDMVKGSDDTVEPGISVHSSDATIGATINGSDGMRLIGGTTQTITFTKPQNCTLTGPVTAKNVNLRFSKADGTSIGMSAGQTIHFGDTIKLSASRYLKLHPWTSGVHTSSTSDKVTISSDIELADGAYITVDDGSYVFSGDVSVLENATAKFTPNWRKGWVFTNLNVPASATFSVEQDQHNDSNSSVLYITGGTVSGTLNLKGTAADRPVLTSLTSSVVTGAKAVNLKGAVSLDLGNVTSAMTSHFVSQEGVNSLTVTCEYSNGSGSISTTDTKDSPLIKIESGSTLNLAYNNFSGWAGDLTNGYIVNEGTLNIANKDNNSAFFRNHLILADGAVTTLNNTYSSVILYGGVGTEATAQIQLPSGTAEIAGGENSLGFALGNNKNDGGYGGKGAGITVGDDAALTISAKVVNKWNNAKGDNLVKYGNGALILSNSENTYTGDVTLKAGTIQSATTLNVTTDVVDMMVVGDGTEATPYALAKIVAKIGDVKYASIAAAMADATEETVIDLIADDSTAVALAKNITVRVAEGEMTVSGIISGAYSVVKTGTGTLTLSGANTFTGGLNVNAGEVKADAQGAFSTGTITVGNGATLNLNGHAANANGYTIVSNGGTIKSERADIYANVNCIKSLSLTANTTIVGSKNFGLSSANADETTLTLNGYTLNLSLEGDGKRCFNTRNTRVTDAGTIALGEKGYLLVYDDNGRSFSGNEVKVTMSSTAKFEINNKGSAIIKDLETVAGAAFPAANIAANQGTLKVLGTYKNTSAIPKLILGDGATIDVAAVPEGGVVASATTSLTLDGSVKLAINGVETSEYTLAKVGNTVVASPAVTPIKPGETTDPQPEEPTDDELARYEPTPVNQAAADAGQGDLLKVVKAHTDAGWVIKSVIDEDKQITINEETKTIKASMDVTAVAFAQGGGLEAVAGATGTTAVTIPAAKVVSGLYYSVSYGTSPDNHTAESDRVLATGSNLTITVPVLGNEKVYFIKIKASAEPTANAQ